MVDLGFLLITFFIYSTEMSKPSVMPLHLPADSTPTLQPESGAITLLLGQNNNIYYYEGKNPDIGKYVDHRSIRTILLDKKRRTNPTWFEVIIKPSKSATFGNMVNILDEMKIDNIHHFVLTDPTPYESDLLRTHI